MAVKVVIIGGGSSYTPEIIEGLIDRQATFPVREIVLVDIEEGREKLEIVGRLAKRMIEKENVEITLSWTLDRRAARGLDASIDAIPESRLKEQSNVDVILIGPQVRYLEGKIKSSVDVPVAVIDNMAYGMMKGDLVLDQALGLVNA